MARRSHEDALGVAGAETVIGSGVNLRGNLISTADIAIDGTVDGTIKTQGNVIVGVNAQIKANISATNVTIAGSVAGNVQATGETSILETGKVEGDITSSGLAISSGGIFVGRSAIDGQRMPVDRPNYQDADAAPDDQPNSASKKSSRNRES